MITVEWKGKAVSVNRWHVVRKGRIYPSNEYESFIDDLAKTVMAFCRRKLTRPDVLIVTTVGKMFDHHNLTKPILDALQRGGALENDRDVGKITLMPPARHKRGELDEIRIYMLEADPPRVGHRV